MYKYLVISVVFFIVGGAGYYFNSSGGSKMLLQAFSQNQGVTTSEVFSGLYECTDETGCGKITHLALKSDGSLDILEITEEDTMSLGKGTWGVTHNGSMVLLLDKPKTATTTYPTSITVKEVSIMKLSNFSSKKKLFPGMMNPVFKRIENLDEGSTALILEN
jgi:hypothetical protein